MKKGISAIDGIGARKNKSGYKNSCLAKIISFFSDIRARTILVIISSTLVIILFSVSAGIIYVQNSVKTSQESDLSLVAKITDSYLSSEIKLLKEQAANAARLLSLTGKDNWQSCLEQLQISYNEYVGLAILDESGARLAHAGELPASGDIIYDEYISLAFTGKIKLSSSVAYRGAGDGDSTTAGTINAPTSSAGSPSADSPSKEERDAYCGADRHHGQ